MTSKQIKDRLRAIFMEILNTDVDDDITITLLSISEIHEASEYDCFRISLSAQVDNTKIPLTV